MAKSVILTLDDEVQVLNAIERDLRAHYAKDYRIVKASSPTLALETLEQLKKRNDQVALLLVDQRMPEMEGTEFLTQALQLYPEAKKVLLTAYADTGAAITAINDSDAVHCPERLCLVNDILSFQSIARHGRYVVRNVLHAGLARCGRDNDLLKHP